MLVLTLVAYREHRAYPVSISHDLSPPTSTTIDQGVLSSEFLLIVTIYIKLAYLKVIINIASTHALVLVIDKTWVSIVRPAHIVTVTCSAMLILSWVAAITVSLVGNGTPWLIYV